jgi:hypothetical protein
MDHAFNKRIEDVLRFLTPDGGATHLYQLELVGVLQLPEMFLCPRSPQIPGR